MTDSDCRRFLCARDDNVEKAADMARYALDWWVCGRARRVRGGCAAGGEALLRARSRLTPPPSCPAPRLALARSLARSQAAARPAGQGAARRHQHPAGAGLLAIRGLGARRKGHRPHPRCALEAQRVQPGGLPEIRGK